MSATLKLLDVDELIDLIDCTGNYTSQYSTLKDMNQALVAENLPGRSIGSKPQVPRSKSDVSKLPGVGSQEIESEQFARLLKLSNW